MSRPILAADLGEKGSVLFFVAGEPKPLARPRATRRGQHAGIYQEKPQWYALVAHEAALAGRGAAFSGPVRVRLNFLMPRLKKMPKTEKPHVTRPDIDNLSKLILDAVTPTLIANDTQVVELHAHKRYALASEVPGCAIELAAEAAEGD